MFSLVKAQSMTLIWIFRKLIIEPFTYLISNPITTFTFSQPKLLIKLYPLICLLLYLQTNSLLLWSFKSNQNPCNSKIVHIQLIKTLSHILKLTLHNANPMSHLCQVVLTLSFVHSVNVTWLLIKLTL